MLLVVVMQDTLRLVVDNEALCRTAPHLYLLSKSPELSSQYSRQQMHTNLYDDPLDYDTAKNASSDMYMCSEPDIEDPT